MSGSKKGRPAKRKKPVEMPESAEKELQRLRMENEYLKKSYALIQKKGTISKKDKVLAIQELRQEYSIADLLRLADIPRSTYYYYRKMLQRPDKYSNAKEHIAEIYHNHHGRYGYRRITLELRNQGCPFNHKTVLRLMKELGLKSLVRMKKYRSYRGARGHIADNLLNRNFHADKPNEKWATDITEVSIAGEKIYFSPVLDLFNGEIVEYEIHNHPTFSLVKKMLDKALRKLNKDDRPILHSDQGWHYQMKKYHGILKEYHVEQSMSRKGNCLNNAVMENFFGLMKSELLYLQKFSTMAEFVTALIDYIHYYNHHRIKSKLKGLTPVEYRNQALLSA